MAEQKQKNHYSVVSMIMAMAAVAIVVGIIQLFGDADIKFCRSALGRLVRANHSVSKQIEWTQLTALGSDIGQGYRALTDPRDREAFQRMFVLSFSEGFRRSGASLGDFSKWRIYRRKTSAETVVAADVPKQKKTVLFTVSVIDGAKRLSSLQWAGITEGKPSVPILAAQTDFATPSAGAGSPSGVAQPQAQ